MGTNVFPRRLAAAFALLLAAGAAAASPGAGRRNAEAVMAAMKAGRTAEVESAANPPAPVDASLSDPWVLVEEMLLAGETAAARSFAGCVKTPDGPALLAYVERAASFPADLPGRRYYLEIVGGKQFDDEETAALMRAIWTDPKESGKSVSGLVTMFVTYIWLMQAGLEAQAADAAIAGAAAAEALGWRVFHSILVSEAADRVHEIAKKTRKAEIVRMDNELAVKCATLTPPFEHRVDAETRLVTYRNAALALLNTLVAGCEELTDPSQFPAALEMARKAVAEITEDTTPRSVSLARVALFDALLANGAYEEAQKVLGQAERVAETDRDVEEIAGRRLKLFMSSGRLDLAAEAGQAFARLVQGKPPHWNHAIYGRDHAWVLHRLGRREDTARAFGTAIRAAQALEQPALEADVREWEARASIERGDWDAAVEGLGGVIALFRKAGNHARLAAALAYRSRTLAMLGRREEAGRDAAEAFRLQESLRSSPLLAKVQLALASVASTPAEEREHLEAACAATAGRKDPDSVEQRALALDALARLDEKAGRSAEASARRAEAEELRRALPPRSGGPPADPFSNAPPAEEGPSGTAPPGRKGGGGR